MKKYLFYNKSKFVVIMLLKAVQSAIMVGFALLFQKGVNMLYDHVPISKFLYMILFMLGYVIVFGLVMFIKETASASYINKAIDKLRSDFSMKLIKLSYEEFSKNDSSKYISNLTNDMKTISTNYFMSLMAIPDEIFGFIFSLGIAFYIHYLAALTMLGLTMLVFIVPLIFNKPLNKANLALSDSMKEFTRIIKETFLGIDVIKNFNCEEKISGQIKDYGAALAKNTTTIDRLNAFSSGTGMMIVVLLQIGSIAISGYLMLKGALLIGAVIAIVQLGNSLFMPVVNISTKAALISGVKDLSKTVTDVLNEISDKQTEKINGLTNCIEFREVSFKFDGEKKTVLSDVSLKFEKGKKYLIAGRSGSGKSTLLKLISKMHSGYDGEILFDSTQVCNTDEKDLNNYISFAQQKSYLFNRSVRDNIDFNSTGDALKLKNAIKLSCLSEFLERLDNGIDTVIDEEVNQVSGGEKLRVGLARALYKDADILLLDEITSALDKENAYTVEKNMLSLNDKTVISVSHKIHKDLLDSYDKIGIMEDGRLILFETPKTAYESDIFKKYIMSEAI